MSNETGGYAVIPRSILRDSAFPAHAKWVLLTLDSYRGENESAWPAQLTIMECTGLSERAVRTAIRWLEGNGYLRTEKMMRSDQRWGLRYFPTYDRFGGAGPHRQGVPVAAASESVEVEPLNESH